MPGAAIFRETRGNAASAVCKEARGWGVTAGEGPKGIAVGLRAKTIHLSKGAEGGAGCGHGGVPTEAARTLVAAVAPLGVAATVRRCRVRGREAGQGAGSDCIVLPDEGSGGVSAVTYASRPQPLLPEQQFPERPMCQARASG